jgi:hypothetical protein
MSDPMTTATAEMFLRRAEAAEAERDRLREALEDMARHVEMPDGEAWETAYRDLAQMVLAALAGSVSDKDRT